MASGASFRTGTSFVDAIKTGPSMVNSSQHISNLDIVGDDGSDSSKMHVQPLVSMQLQGLTL